ncbi:uncharacterized protein EI97DRAFT_453404 [Westerdykella ornata]|uniref:Uncharacterized protein n=1 Tax=Westerdykella ornata TaxID=318751 RepID=A0A6A6J9E7_WESOR|nr:uncharacterized protein EI97DRAFT_453404 [Westerdykella ornata]KAF2271849.1 hypothetical protein EI97DRAFT_453404 [Westerdykella ornata]
MPNTSEAPAELFEPRQTATSADFTPNPEKSLPLSRERQELLDDILALYCCQPTVARLKRYTPDAIYDDEFSYANDRYKIAGQWFAMPKIFEKAVNEGYEVVRSDHQMIQFKNKQSWTFRLIPKTITVTHLITLSLDPSTRDTDFMQIKYHKDQANDRDYSHEGVRFGFKKWQAEMTARFLPNAPELAASEADRRSGGEEEVRRWGTGTEEGDAPKGEYRR